MGRIVATVFFAILIWQLYRLTRDGERETSWALWLPTYWLFIGSSRNLSEWLHLSGGVGGRSVAYTEGSPLDRAVFTLVLALGVIVLLGRAGRVGTILRSNLPILLYFLYCLTSALWSDFPDVAVKRWFKASGDIVMVLILLTDPDWVAALKRILIRLGNVLVPLSLLFSRWYPEYGRSFSHAGEPYWTGVTPEKNALGALCLVYGLAFLYYFLETYREEKSTRRKNLLMAYSVVIVIALYLLDQSRSATALASFFLAGLPMVLIFRYPTFRKPALVHLMVLGSLGVAVSALFFNMGSGMLEEMGRNVTLTGRTAIWQAALSLAESPVVGTGFESFWIGPRYEHMAELTGMYLNQAHNGFLEIYLNLGWIGIALLALVLITAYRRVVTGVRWATPASSLRLAFFMIAISENFTEASFGMAGAVWIGFLVTTMAVPEVPGPSELPLPGLGPAEYLPQGKPEERSIPVPVGRRFARTDFRKSLVPSPSFRRRGNFDRNPGHNR
jgi:exopolysaccharide production protein ExoQ